MANPSIFFTLPLELRNEIYAYLVVGRHDVATPSLIDGVSLREFREITFFGLLHRCLLMDIAWADVRYDNFDLIWLDYPRPLMETSWADWKDNSSGSFVYDPSILRVSRQIYEEASKMLYNSSIFLFEYAVSHLNKQISLNMGDLERNLHRVRDLEISISEDLFNPNLTSAGITHTLQWFARRAKSLQWVTIRFDVAATDLDPSIKSFLHSLLPATDLPETLCAFHVTNGLQISIAGHFFSFPYHHYEKWPLYVAEKKDWEIHKYIDKVYHKGSDEPARTIQVIWTIKPGKILRRGHSDPNDKEKVVEPSNRIVKVVEHLEPYPMIFEEELED